MMMMMMRLQQGRCKLRGNLTCDSSTEDTGARDDSDDAADDDDDDDDANADDNDKDEAMQGLMPKVS